MMDIIYPTRLTARELTLWSRDIATLYNLAIPYGVQSMPDGLDEQTIASILLAPNSVFYLYVRPDHTVSELTAVANGMWVGLGGIQAISWIDGVGEPALAVEQHVQRSGIGRQISQHLLYTAWNVLGLRRLQLTTLTDAPSRHLVEAMGFTQEGIRKQVRYRAGEYVDAICYGLLR